MGSLMDPYGRKIDYLRVSVIDRCNLKCFYCVPEPGSCSPSQTGVMDIEEIIKIIKAAAALGIEKVRLTGGEPLIRADIVELVYRISQIKEISDISLTTNAVLLDKLASKLVKAGLNRVNISLDSLDPEIFKEITRGGALQKTLQGITTALAEGLTPVKINMVAMKGINSEEISKFVKLTLDNDLHVRFIEYMPVNKHHEEQWKKHFMPLSEIQVLCEKIGALKREEAYYGNGPADYYRIEGAKGLIGFISPVSRHFCSKCNRLRVTSDGKIKPCLFSAEEIDLKEAESDEEKIKEMFTKALKLRPDPYKIDKNPNGRFNCNKREMLQIGG
ncbi:MAG: GTP 3',8-cyclase MoaA [Firmicutes bacterium HGW-Firmicutes-13]|nr:MAG: GTP 3',8-cyclase MoaA [Firmicutes bacterium HGW-Firmicutes-13]